MKPVPFLLLLFCTSANVFGQTGDRVQGSSDVFFIPVERTIRIQLPDRVIPVLVQQYGSPTDIVYFNMHDNEESAVDAAVAVLVKRGGTLVKIENNNQRVIRFKLNGIHYAFDPNRIFSDTGIEQTLRENRRYSKEAAGIVRRFADELLAMIPDSVSLVVALHNNFDGAFSIKSYLPGGERQRDAKAVYANPDEDIDDIVLTTDSLIYAHMAEQGFNSIWQDNDRAKKDGSLSIYCGERNIRYVNVETEHGKVDQYMLMLEKLLHLK
jgi:hypothetical protein